MIKNHSKFNGFAARASTFLLFVLLFAVLLSSCATDITGVPIAEVEITLHREDGRKVNRLLPDTEYRMRALATDANGKRYLNPDHYDYHLENLRNLEVTDRGRDYITLRTAKETFHPAGSALYGFTLKIQDNPFTGSRAAFPLDWQSYDYIDYRGAAGKDGEDGEDGAIDSSNPRAVAYGASGEDGRIGSDGEDGVELHLAVARYRWENDIKLLVFDIERQRLFLCDLRPITVSSSGGRGGNGGRGGDMAPGQEDSSEEAESMFFNFATAGDGGNGGRGGDGGSILLRAADPTLFNYINPQSSGGRGGDGGYAGSNGPASRGRDGRDGRNGQIRYEVLEPDKLRTLFSGVQAAGFNSQNIIIEKK